MVYTPVPPGSLATFLLSVDRSPAARGYRVVTGGSFLGPYLVFGTYRNFRIASRVQDQRDTVLPPGSVAYVLVPDLSGPAGWLFCTP